jgi:GWxTD domain-containing protein
MRTAVICAAALAACCIVAIAAPLDARQGMERPREGGFELFLTQDYGDGSESVLVAGVAIPYRRLVFFLRNGRYEARYRVYLEIIDERGKRVRGEVWEESVEAADFRETTSSASLARSSRRFPAAPGSYRAVATIEIVDTSRRFTREETARIVGGEGGRLELSKPSFYAVVAGSPPAGPAAAVRFARCEDDSAVVAGAVQGSIFGQAGASAHIRYNLFVPEGEAGRRIVFSTRARDASGTVVQYHRAALAELAPGPAALCLDLDIDDWPIGYYTIESVVESPAARLRAEAGGRFLVLFNGGLLGSNVADCAALLSLIAGADEVRDVVEAPPEERMRAWAAFWRKRDPSPATSSNEAFGEFLERLRYVLENFSRTRPGFRTDRGRVYIENGPPDRVETRSEPAARSYELWYYTGKGVVYIFEDAIGSGDYRLITTRLL